MVVVFLVEVDDLVGVIGLGVDVVALVVVGNFGVVVVA